MSQALLLIARRGKGNRRQVLVLSDRSGYHGLPLVTGNLEAGLAVHGLKGVNIHSSGQLGGHQVFRGAVDPYIRAKGLVWRDVGQVLRALPNNKERKLIDRAYEVGIPPEGGWKPRKERASATPPQRRLANSGHAIGAQMGAMA